MIPKEGRPIHPGEIIQHTYLGPYKLTRQQLADAIGITHISINEILLGERSITPDTAFRLAKFFNTSADFWIALQMHVDMWDTLQSNKDEYENIIGVA